MRPTRVLPLGLGGKGRPEQRAACPHAAARSWKELLIFSTGLFIRPTQRKPARSSSSSSSSGIHEGYLWGKFMHLTA